MSRVCVARAYNQRVTSAGRRVVDLVMRDGSVVHGAVVMTGVSLPVHVPFKNDTPLSAYQYYPRVLAVSDHFTRAFVVVGLIDNPNVVYDAAPPDVVTSGTTDGRDVDDDVTYTLLEEARIDAGGSAFIMRQTGAAVLKADIVSVQLPAGSYLRVSEEGDSAERTVLAGPVLAKMQHMVDTINELRQAVLDLQQALLLVTVAPPANSTLTTQTGGQVTGTLNIISTPVYTGLPEDDVDDLSLTAAAIHMSARSEADES